MKADEKNKAKASQKEDNCDLPQELNRLAVQQMEALRTAMLAGMTSAEAREYNKRHRRIMKLMNAKGECTGAPMSKRKQKLHGTVKKVIKPRHSGEKEKAEIDIQEAEDLYREIRVNNELTDEKGEKASLKPGAEVEVVIEADSDATTKKPD